MMSFKLNPGLPMDGVAQVVREAERSGSRVLGVFSVLDTCGVVAVLVASITSSG